MKRFPYLIFVFLFLAAPVAFAESSCRVVFGRMQTEMVKREARLPLLFIVGGLEAGSLGAVLAPSNDDADWKLSFEEEILLTQDIRSWSYNDLKEQLDPIAKILRTYLSAKERHSDGDDDALRAHQGEKNAYAAYFVTSLLVDRSHHNSGWIRKHTAKDLANKARELGMKFPSFTDPGDAFNDWMKQFALSGTFSDASDAQVEALIAQTLKSHVGYAILASVMLQSPYSDNPTQVSKEDLIRGQSLYEEAGIVRAIAGSRMKENTYLADFLDHPMDFNPTSQFAVKTLKRRR